MQGTLIIKGDIETLESILADSVQKGLYGIVVYDTDMVTVDIDELRRILELQRELRKIGLKPKGV
jgi:hypothetical protein